MAEIDPTPQLPAHVEDTVQSVARLHTDHHQNATQPERLIARITGIVSAPAFIGAMVVTAAVWIGLNLGASALGYAVFDPPPFFWLTGTVSLASFFLVILVIGTQRRDDHLAAVLEQLTLQLAMLSEQKLAKVIELLEEARRDNPLIPDREDRQADDMARPADSQSVLEAIKKARTAADPTPESTAPSDPIPEA